MALGAQVGQAQVAVGSREHSGVPGLGIDFKLIIEKKKFQTTRGPK